jgi:multimeric flavodoxin WrbA
MKILAINSSPNREGTTSGIIDVILEECEALGANCDKINIEDYQIMSCQGCYNCSDKVACKIDDDFMQLKARVLDADGIIIGSPYYSGRAVENAEAFLDRVSLSAFVYKEFRGKYFVGLSTSAVDNSINVASFCANLGYDAGRGGAMVSDVIWESTVLEEGMKEIKDDEAIRYKAKGVAKKLIKNISSKKISLSYVIRDYTFPGWLNLIIIKFKRIREFYFKKILEYLKDKGILKNSQKIV